VQPQSVWGAFRVADQRNDTCHRGGAAAGGRRRNAARRRLVKRSRSRRVPTGPPPANRQCGEKTGPSCTRSLYTPACSLTTTTRVGIPLSSPGSIDRELLRPILIARRGGWPLCRDNRLGRWRTRCRGSVTALDALLPTRRPGGPAAMWNAPTGGGPRLVWPARSWSHASLCNDIWTGRNLGSGSVHFFARDSGVGLMRDAFESQVQNWREPGKHSGKTTG